jgi:hypothetical protein
VAGLPETQCQENFSFAYIRALASAAGLSVIEESDDYDSIDLYIKAIGAVSYDGRTSARISPTLAMQVKCTYSHQPKEGVLNYPLQLKNYNDLREPMRGIPAVLVVLCIPSKWTQRLRWTESSLSMRRVAYWKSLKGEPATSNTESVTISMTELLSPPALTRLMFESAEGTL